MSAHTAPLRAPHPIERGRTPDADRAAFDRALRDWLEGQSRVLAHWRDLATAFNEDPTLVGALDDHARFLEMVALGGVMPPHGMRHAKTATDTA